MVKKLPLIIPTLTLLISGLAPTAAWAEATKYSEAGPWSFEELMMAEKDIQEIINEVCPNEWVPMSCAHEYVYGETVLEPIYAKLGNFESSQFYLLSLDPVGESKNTVQAYFRSENTWQKYTSEIQSVYDEQTGSYKNVFGDPALFKRDIVKLYIYQIEKNHEPWMVIQDMENGVDPYWRMLYADEAPEGEVLFPAGQEVSFEIDAYSYDADYRDIMAFSYETDRGELNTFVINMSDCHKGGDVCKMYYVNDPREPDPRLVNKPTYEEGYDDGYEDGFNDGERSGYEAGYEDGLADGYDSGYEDGFTDGKDSGYDSGYEDGFTDGEMEGYNQGYDRGLDEGYNQGFEEGYLRAIEELVDTEDRDGDTGGADGEGDGGVADGATDGVVEIFENGSAGSEIPLNSNVINIGFSSEAESQIITTDADNVARKTSSKYAHTPNTGAQTVENETNGVEFPWWIGAIFALGLITAVWIFLPNRKNHPKKS